MIRLFENLEEFKSAVGEQLGSSEWLTVSQEMINKFAHVTGDYQWIHVDTDRVKGGPFGKTIAHGYYILSLLPKFADEIYAIKNFTFGVNYGSNKVRYPAPVPVGSRIRAKASLKEANELASGTQFAISFVIEIEGSEKPACVAEVVYVMTP